MNLESGLHTRTNANYHEGMFRKAPFNVYVSDYILEVTVFQVKKRLILFSNAFTSHFVFLGFVHYMSLIITWLIPCGMVGTITTIKFYYYLVLLFINFFLTMLIYNIT